MDKQLPFSKLRPRTLPPEYQALLDWQCAHQIFEATASQQPETVAIISGTKRFTYREVNEHAERLARHIVKLGLPVETLIGVYADRCPELLIAFVGILKAGCVYVPLDTQHPAERLKYMLDEMQARLVLTAEEGHPFKDAPGTEFISVAQCLADDPGQVAGYPRTLKPNNLAYGIFTSGSTGKPKGAMLEHRGLVNFCHYFKHFHGYQPGERCAEMVRPGFDASMSELAGFFFNGVCVCIPPNDVLANPARLVDYIVEHQVTRGFAPTPLGELLIEEDWPAEGVALIELQMGGEALRKRTTKRHSFQVTNVYGPTENTNISTVYRVENLEDDARPIPIGYAVANTEAIILGEDLKPVAPGAEGELFLGGVQLARCYLNRPDLTAEKFIPHPFDKTPGARLYRSGDLVRARADGAIEYISRIDFQIKIRGNRIELGEIENVLNGLPGVKQAVVVPLLKDGKPQSLAAFWTADPAAATSGEALRVELGRLLTKTMVPAYFVQLDKLPLSPNGKIDRRALPVAELEAKAETASAAGAQANSTAVVPPGDELEKALWDFWTAVLKRSDFGIRNNFIDLGGTSLNALRIVAQIHRKLKREVPVGQIYVSGTIEKLAAFMRSNGREAAGLGARNSCLIQIQPGREGVAPLFGIHGFGGHIFQFYLLAKHLGPDVPVYALRGHGLEAGEEPDDTCVKMAQRYLKLLLPAAGKHPVHLAGYSMGGLVALEIARLLQAQGARLGMLGILDVFGPGYPRRMPFKARMKLHARTVLSAGFSEKKRYLAKRISNISQRVHFMFGVPYVDPEERQGTEAIIPKAVFWAHRHACDAYAPVRFEGSIDLLTAETPPDWPGNIFDDPHLGWTPYMRSIETHRIPGSHWTMIKEPAVRRVAAVLNERMAARHK